MIVHFHFAWHHPEAYYHNRKQRAWRLPSFEQRHGSECCPYDNRCLPGRGEIAEITDVYVYEAECRDMRALFCDHVITGGQVHNYDAQTWEGPNDHDRCVTRSILEMFQLQEMPVTLAMPKWEDVRWCMHDGDKVVMSWGDPRLAAPEHNIGKNGRIYAREVKATAKRIVDFAEMSGCYRLYLFNANNVPVGCPEGFWKDVRRELDKHHTPISLWGQPHRWENGGGVGVMMKLVPDVFEKIAWQSMWAPNVIEGMWRNVLESCPVVLTPGDINMTTCLDRMGCNIEQLVEVYNPDRVIVPASFGCNKFRFAIAEGGDEPHCPPVTDRCGWHLSEWLSDAFRKHAAKHCSFCYNEPFEGEAIMPMESAPGMSTNVERVVMSLAGVAGLAEPTEQGKIGATGVPTAPEGVE